METRRITDSRSLALPSHRATLGTRYSGNRPVLSRQNRGRRTFFRYRSQLKKGSSLMMRALHTAASGMAGQQFNIDTIANNLANVNTTGFKKSRADFQDLLYQS